MTRIMLVDDHAVVREGYRRFIERQPDMEVVAEASNAETAVDQFRRHQPDLCIVDFTLPGLGALALIPRLFSYRHDIHVLVFSMHEEAAYAMRSLEAGARGYVSKSNPPEVLIQAIREVVAGRIFLSPDIAPLIESGRNEDHPIKTLTSKEFEVFRLLSAGRSLVEIGEMLHLSQKTVANYQTLIKEKLNAPTLAALVHIALRHGILSTPPQI